MYQTLRRLIHQGIPPTLLWWVRLDHPLLMDVPLGTLVKGILGASKPSGHVYVFLDELTYARNWDLWLKTFYDEDWPIRLLASSSSTAVLRDRRLESGVGRWEEQYLSPYLLGEYLGLAGQDVDVPGKATLGETIAACVEGRVEVAHIEPFRRRLLLTGGFPELLRECGETTDEEFALLESQRILRSDSVDRAVYKDIPQAFGIDRPAALERLLYVLAGQVTGILSPSSVAASAGNLSLPTLDRYLSYLIQAFLVFTVGNYSGSEETRQRRGRKVYFVDGAVRNAALQRGLAPVADPMEMGILVENLVAAHLHVLGQHSGARLYHWREKDREVDLVYDHPASPLAFEIGLSPRHSRKGLVEFQQRFPRFRGRCYLVAPGAVASGPAHASDEIGSLPLDLLLLAVSKQSQLEMAKGEAALTLSAETQE
jgi:predicted AAA+ superfamily ATPase